MYVAAGYCDLGRKYHKLIKWLLELCHVIIINDLHRISSFCLPRNNLGNAVLRLPRYWFSIGKQAQARSLLLGRKEQGAYKGKILG